MSVAIWVGEGSAVWVGVAVPLILYHSYMFHSLEVQPMAGLGR